MRVCVCVSLCGVFGHFEIWCKTKDRMCVCVCVCVKHGTCGSGGGNGVPHPDLGGDGEPRPRRTRPWLHGAPHGGAARVVPLKREPKSKPKRHTVKSMELILLESEHQNPVSIWQPVFVVPLMLTIFELMSRECNRGGMPQRAILKFFCQA